MDTSAQRASRRFGALQAALAAHYALERELGRGGMATVYLARDVRHGRQVAVKVLHPELAAVLGATRFLSEIRTTAALQHPHILPLFDSGDADGHLFYVMPYVEGETLRARLARERQLPVADAVRIAAEVASALEHAHRRGVIHRDVKPENILLGDDGQALVADFGIALAVSNAAGERVTESGIALGTPQYMAPEQASGERAVDARADVYALGVVTYEMLAGEPPFTAPTMQGVIARLMTETPRPVASVRRSVSPTLSAVVDRALEKLPADRFATASELSTALQDASHHAAPAVDRAPVAEPRGARRRWRAWLGLLPWLVAVAAIGAAVVWGRRASVVPAAIVASLEPPAGTQFALGGNFALAPDGRRLAFVASNAIWVRHLDSLDATRLGGTDGASWPFWSPDGRSLGFFAANQLRIIPAEGGVSRALCPAPEPRGASWSTHGVIVFGAGTASGLQRVSVDGGPCTVATNSAGEELSHVRPAFFPDGRHFVFSSFGSGGRLFVGELGTTTHRPVPGHGSSPQVVPPDWVLYAQDTTIYAQRLDLRETRFVGEPAMLLQTVTRVSGIMSYTASATGTLVAHGAPIRRRMVWVDGHGAVTDSLPLTSQSFFFDYAHDGKRVALGGWGVFVHDLERGVATRITSAEGIDAPRITITPVWSPDDSLLAYVAGLAGPFELRLIDVSRGTSERLYVAGARETMAESWSPDGRELTFTMRPGGGAPRAEVWIYSRANRVARPLLSSPAYDFVSGRFSPDGRWLAYVSTETGRAELYVRPYPLGGPPQRLSAEGGEDPRWSRDGRELLFRDARGRIESVALTTGSSSAFSAPRTLVARPPDDRDFRPGDFERDPNGQRIVLLQESTSASLILMSDWRTRVADRH